MSNNPTPTPPRIEREAEEIAVPLRLAGPTGRQQALGFKKGYVTGSLSEIERAAPVVKALEDRLKEWEAGYQDNCAFIDRLNKDRRKYLFWAGEDYKMNYPPIPAWVTEAKQILETYKADV